MEPLGYYAKDVNNNLFQFKWELDNTFLIKCVEPSVVGWVVADPKDYEILEIGFFTAEPIDKTYGGFEIGESVICNGDEDRIIDFVNPTDSENWGAGYRLVLRNHGTQSLGCVFKKSSN
jgi:hypothetical protein